ncbi:MAG: Gfo/Idh/MocA family oxidoreductase [Planctomycetota bacterium]
MKPIRAGIIGFGRVAEKSHLPKMQECGCYDMIGVCDITEARRKFAQDLGLKATASISDFLNWDIELVVITTHSSQHYADALKVAAAGKHMLIEKPMSMTGQQAEEMVAAAKANNVVLNVMHNRHFDPDYRLVKAAVQDGLLGDLVAVENRTIGSAPAVGYGTPDYNQQWRVTAAAGGGTLLDFGPHWVEQVLDLMAGEKVVQVFGDVRHIKWGDADDLFRIDMIFESGVRASAAKCDIAYYSPPDKWLIFGTEATLHGPVSVGDQKQIVVRGPDYELKRAKMVPAINLHVNLAEHIREGKDLVITTEHSLRVMQVIQAGVDSAKAGKSVDVAI